MLAVAQIADCRSDLLSFYRTAYSAMGNKFEYNWHMQTVCEALEKVVIGKIKRLIINIPPRACKSQMAVINFIAWCLGNWPHAEFIVASHSKSLAEENNYKARALLMHEIYGEIFGSCEFKKDSRAKDFFKTHQGGHSYAVGTSGLVAGFGAGKLCDSFGGALIIDDPHNPTESLSLAMRRQAIDWYNFNVEYRLNTPDTPVILIMQRVHPEDLTGYLLANDTLAEWTHIKIPALDKDSNVLWPARYNKDRLLAMLAKTPFAANAQLLQEPTLPGGNLIKTADFGRYEILPQIQYRIIYADTAQKTKEHNDYSVFECWGYGQDKKIYLIDLIRGKWEAPELKKRAIDFWAKHKACQGEIYRGGIYGELRTIKIEDAASGTGLIQELQLKDRLPIQAITRIKDKYTRLTDVADYIRSGYVCIPENSAFVNDFVVECESFTADDTHAHDDQIDPMIDAITDMLATLNPMALWANFR